jgi:hypothetical protein
VITGYDSFEAWVDTAGNALNGQSNLFVYEFDKATGNQVVPNYQYLVPHMEPIGDEYNFWNSQFPLLYFPEISFNALIPGALNYFHIDYRTNSGVNFTEANMILTTNDKRNDCENKEIIVSLNGVVITSTNAIVGPTPNTQNNLTISDTSIGNLIRDCQGVLSNSDNLLEKTFLYPNPANDYVFTNTEVIYFSIKDALGRIIKTSSTIYTNSIYVGDLGKGLYFITIKNNSGKLKTYKILKE